MVERLLKAGATPGTVLPTGETMLMLAARAGSVEAVSLLVSAGTDLNVVEATTGQDALMWAAAERHNDVVQLLLDKGARADSKSKSGFTALHFAARTGDIGTARLLLTAGANLNETAVDGSTPLLVATVRGHTALGSFLLEQGANPNLGGFTPLHRAAGSWDTELSSRVSDGNEWRVQGGLRGTEKVAFVRALLARGADPNRRVAPGLRGAGEAGSTAFLLAAKAGDAEVMRLLLEHGADPSIVTNQNTTALMAAAGVGRNVFSNVPEAGARAAVEICLQQRAGEINAVNAAGETALHGAAYIGANSIVEILVKRGADMNVKNKRNWTPLVIAEGVFTAATFQRYPATADLLLKLGAQPSPPDVYRIGR
jgi:ankyrin repeat protein